MFLIGRNVFAFVLSEHGYSSAWQQVFNKDIVNKPYSKAHLKTFAGTEVDSITSADGRVLLRVNCINAPVGRPFYPLAHYSRTMLAILVRLLLRVCDSTSCQ